MEIVVFHALLMMRSPTGALFGLVALFSWWMSLLVQSAAEESPAPTDGWNHRNKKINFSPEALHVDIPVKSFEGSDKLPIENQLEVETLKGAGLLIHHKQMCLTHANKAGHCINRIDNSMNLDTLRQDSSYLPDSTYWLNEYLHVGHMMYDLVLLQLLALQKIDRIIIQRAACYESLCHGIGSFESFFKGYFVIALEAFSPGVNTRQHEIPMSKRDGPTKEFKHSNNNTGLSSDQRIIPIYLRWGWKEHEVKPVLLSSAYLENEFENDLHSHAKVPKLLTPIVSSSPVTTTPPNEEGDPMVLLPIPLQHRMCFEDVYRRNVAGGGHHFFGSIHSKHIQTFKMTAYRIMNDYIVRGKPVFVPPSYLKAYYMKLGKEDTVGSNRDDKTSHPSGFVSLKGVSNFLTPPSDDRLPALIEIMIAYRGPKASRYLSNIYDLIKQFEQTFPSPKFIVHSLNTSDNTLTFQQQIVTIAPCQVVITNHGAYESNLIYMQNKALLIEIGGDYDNNEFHTYEQMAQMFGLYYGRIHVAGLKTHDDREGMINELEMKHIITMVKDYFDYRITHSNN